MRVFRCASAIVALLLVLTLAGCGGASVSGILRQNGISAKAVSGMKAELRYLRESKGANYKFIDISGDGDLIAALLDELDKSASAGKPKDKQFLPELRSDCEIVLTNGNGEAVTFLYVAQDNMLIYPERTDGKDGETLEYRYFTPGSKLGALLQGQRQNAKLMQDNALKPFRSMAELKASIDPEDLSEAGADIEFEFFTDATPENSGTACCAYSHSDFAAVPQDSLLITAYGKTKTGEQEKLSIQGMTANSNYTKIIVEEPDESLDLVDTGDALPDSYAILVKKEAIDPGKWIVFMDADGNVLDIILPEDIEGLPQTTANAGAGATPAVTSPADGKQDDTD